MAPWHNGNRRRRHTVRPWTWCAKCGCTWLYDSKIVQDSVCLDCGAPFPLPENSGNSGHKSKDQTTPDPENLAAAVVCYKSALQQGDVGLSSLLESLVPQVRAPVTTSTPKTPLQKLRAASQANVAAKQKLERSIDRIARLKLETAEAERIAVEDYAALQKAETEEQAAKAEHARASGIEAHAAADQRSKQARPSLECTEVPLELQGLEEDAELAQQYKDFLALQKMLLESAKAKRLANESSHKRAAEETDAANPAKVAKNGQGQGGDAMDDEQPPGQSGAGSAGGAALDASLGARTALPEEHLGNGAKASSQNQDDQMAAARKEALDKVKATTATIDPRTKQL